MKKKNLKSLSLNKKSISNLQKDTVSGGYTTAICYIVTKKAFEVGVSLAVCQEVTDACITGNNEYSCECTIA